MLPKLEKILPKSLQKTASFKQALTHRSASGKHNERMEFLGDSVLGVIITEALYTHMPNASEGYLSRLRASLVNEGTLADIAIEISLGDYLYLGSGELKSGGFRRKSILSDALEAIIASVFLQQGMDEAKKFVLILFDDRLQKLPAEDELKDPKSRLQELLQSRNYSIPQYDLISTKGHAHRQLFTAECFIEGLKVRTQGISTSRRKAEQKAALFAFEQVKKEFK
ncbi:MAG TPA: ribonuclease III [Leucothrix mucor]|uniref:Ribonuclease 3 n=1 Tax=Leucothrix mucor TaxID=45248 RepID=A0A7V2SZK7_LEUMU|nr:ribonuclease III [Leucothrix mucor]